MKRITFLLALWYFFAAAPPAHAADFQVPSTYLSIQAGINAAAVAASPPHRVVVDNSATPYAPFVMADKVSVVAASGATPIVDGSGTAYAARVPLSVTHSVSIQGLTLRGGDTTLVCYGNLQVLDDVIDSYGDDTKIGVFVYAHPTSSWSNLTVRVKDTGTAAIGVMADSGDVNIGNSFIDVNSADGDYGYKARKRGAGSPVVPVPILYGSIIKAPKGTGIYMPATLTDGIIDSCTVDSVKYYGIDAQDSKVRHTIVTHRSTGGALIYAKGSKTEYCITYPSGIDYVSMSGTGTDCVQEDPLYRDPVNRLYSLRVDSYGNPENNPSGLRLGADDVSCMFGTLVRSSTLAVNTAIEFLGDATVPTGKSLTLGQGSALNVATSDSQSGGSDASKVELIVRGTLTVSGAAGNVVTVHSAAGSPSEDDWYGISTSSSYPATLSLSYADIQHSVLGVIAGGVLTSTISHCSFSNNDSYDVYCASAGDSLPVTVSNCTFSVGGSTGLELVGGLSGATVSNNTFTGDGTSDVAINTYLATATSSPSITQNTASGFTNGKCVNIVNGTEVLTKNTLSNSKYGIYVSKGNPTIGTAADTTSDNIVTGHSSAGAFFTGSLTTGKVRQSRFTSNSKGIVTKGSANPDLGTSGDYGKNIATGNSTYCLENQSTSGTVSAEGNYLGTANPPTCTNGSFDLNNYLGSVPAGAQAGGLTSREPDGGSFELKAPRPNPVHAATAIGFVVSLPVAHVQLGIYDVAGRRVRSMSEMTFGNGYNEIVWDATGDDGARVANGLYFVRVVANGHIQSASKVLVSR